MKIINRAVHLVDYAVEDVIILVLILELLELA